MIFGLFLACKPTLKINTLMLESARVHFINICKQAFSLLKYFVFCAFIFADSEVPLIIEDHQIAEFNDVDAYDDVTL